MYHFADYWHNTPVIWNMPANSMGGLEHVADPYKVCALGAH
jgi:hypothetical protein